MSPIGRHSPGIALVAAMSSRVLERLEQDSLSRLAGYQTVSLLRRVVRGRPFNRHMPCLCLINEDRI